MSSTTILHITGMQSTKYGSVEQFLLLLSAVSKRAGYQSILQYDSQPTSAAFLDDAAKHDIPIYCTPTTAALTTVFQNLRRLLMETRPQIVHTHFSYGMTQVILPYVARFYGASRLIATVHSPITSGARAKRISFRNYDFILSTSKMVERGLANVGINPEKTFTHYLGIQPFPERDPIERVYWRNALRLPDQSRVVACIAFDASVKGLDVLLHAFADVCKKYDDVYLVIIGVDSSTSELPRLAESLGVLSRTRWPGIIDEGWRLLNAADIYVQPSRKDAFALAVAEAMAMKLPIVLTSTTGASELLTSGEDAFVVEPEDPGALAESLAYLIDHKKTRDKMGTAGYAKALNELRAENSAKLIVERYYNLQVPVETICRNSRDM